MTNHVRDPKRGPDLLMQTRFRKNEMTAETLLQFFENMI